jgi:transposase
MRGIDLVAAVTVLDEIGDLSRFASPRGLMGYPSLVPCESYTGDTVNRGSITKAGNGRRILVEAEKVSVVSALLDRGLSVS